MIKEMSYWAAPDVLITTKIHKDIDKAIKSYIKDVKKLFD